MPKTDECLAFLARATPTVPGQYECTMPRCTSGTLTEDGFCPIHTDLPLRLVKRR